MNLVNDADDHGVDGQGFGFRSQSRAAALGDQNEVVFTGAERVDRDERPAGGDQRLTNQTSTEARGQDGYFRRICPSLRHIMYGAPVAFGACGHKASVEATKLESRPSVWKVSHDGAPK